MKKFSIIIIIAAVALLTSCTIKVSNKGDKDAKQITKKLDLKDFHGILITGSGNVEYVQDSIYKVEIIGSEQSLKDLKLEVRDSLLAVSREDNGNIFNGRKIIINDSKYIIRVSSPFLKTVVITGSGDFQSKKPLNTDNFEVSIAGSGNIDFNTITAKSVKVSITGSGDVTMKEKDVDNTSLNIAGSGNIDVNFSNCNIVTTSTLGSGDITLKGDIKNLQNNNDNTDISELKIKK